MIDFVPVHDLKDLRPRRETLRFALRNESFRFSRFFRLAEAQNAMAAKSTAAFGLARGSCSTLRLRDSGMAPQPVEIAQNGLEFMRTPVQSAIANRACQIRTQNKAAPITSPSEPMIVGSTGPPVRVKTKPISVIGVAITKIQN